MLHIFTQVFGAKGHTQKLNCKVTLILKNTKIYNIESTLFAISTHTHTCIHRHTYTHTYIHKHTNKPIQIVVLKYYKLMSLTSDHQSLKSNEG